MEGEPNAMLTALLEGVETHRARYAHGNMFPFMALKGQLLTIAMHCQHHPEMGELLVEEIRKALESGEVENR